MGINVYSIGTSDLFTSDSLATDAMENAIQSFLIAHGFTKSGSNYTRGAFKFTFTTNYSNRVEMTLSSSKYSKSNTVNVKGSGTEYYYEPFLFYEIATDNGLWYGFSASSIVGSGHLTNAITGAIETATAECSIHLGSSNYLWADVSSSTNPTFTQNSIKPVCIDGKLYCFDGCLVSGDRYFKGYFGYTISKPDGYTLNNPYLNGSLLVLSSDNGASLVVIQLPF